MKNNYLILSLSFILALASCKNENADMGKEATNENTSTAQLVSFIKYKVLIQDTSISVFMKKDSLDYKGADVDKVMGENVNYLSYKELRLYLENIKKLLNGKETVLADKKLNLAETFEERRGLYAMCDSVEFEENGKKVTTFECDSISRLESIFGLEFYESWSLNYKTGMINKDILGYAALTTSEKGFKPHYYFFKNKESFEKVKAKIQSE